MEKKQFLLFLDRKFYMRLFIIKFYYYITLMLYKSIILAHIQLEVKLCLRIARQPRVISSS